MIICLYTAIRRLFVVSESEQEKTSPRYRDESATEHGKHPQPPECRTPDSRPPECTIPDPKSVARDSRPPDSRPPEIPQICCLGSFAVRE